MAAEEACRIEAEHDAVGTTGRWRIGYGAVQVGALFTTLRTPFPIRDTGVLGQIETGFRTLSAAAVKSLAFCIVKVQVASRWQCGVRGTQGKRNRSESLSLTYSAGGNSGPRRTHEKKMDHLFLKAQNP